MLLSPANELHIRYNMTNRQIINELARELAKKCSAEREAIEATKSIRYELAVASGDAVTLQLEKRQLRNECDLLKSRIQRLSREMEQRDVEIEGMRTNVMNVLSSSEMDVLSPVVIDLIKSALWAH